MITTIIIISTIIISIKCFSDNRLLNKLSLRPFLIVHHKEYYRVITHAFVHADSTHLIFNMITFYSFGNYVEKAFNSIFSSSLPYFGLYFGGMIAASLYDIIKRKNDSWFSSIGASGAVAAVLFTSILLNPWSMLQLFFFIPIPGIVLGIAYLVFCQYMSKHSNDNINHNAHFYGAIFGFIYPIFLKPELLQFFLNRLLRI